MQSPKLKANISGNVVYDSSDVTQPSLPAFIGLHYELIKYAIARCECESASTASLLEGLGYNTGVRIIEHIMTKKAPINVFDERERMKLICKDLWVSLFNKQANRLQTNRRGGYVIYDNDLPWLMSIEKPENGSTSEPCETTGYIEGHQYLVEKQFQLNTEHVGFQPSFKDDNVHCDSSLGGDNTKDNVKIEQETFIKKAPVILKDSVVQLSFLCGIIKGALMNLGVSCNVVAECQDPPACTITVKIIR